jgi:hypothetical protein
MNALVREIKNDLLLTTDPAEDSFQSVVAGSARRLCHTTGCYQYLKERDGLP